MSPLLKIVICLSCEGRDSAGAVGQPVDREAFSGVGDFDDFVVEVEAGSARELDVLVATSDFKQTSVAYRFEEAAVGLVVVGDLVGQDVDEPCLRCGEKRVSHRHFPRADEAAQDRVARLCRIEHFLDDAGRIGDAARNAQRKHLV